MCTANGNRKANIARYKRKISVCTYIYIYTHVFPLRSCFHLHHFLVMRCSLCDGIQGSDGDRYVPGAGFCLMVAQTGF